MIKVPLLNKADKKMTDGGSILADSIFRVNDIIKFYSRACPIKKK